MAKGNKSVSDSMAGKPNPITGIAIKLIKEAETTIKTWIDKPPLLFEATFSAIENAPSYALCTFITTSAARAASSVLPLPPSLKITRKIQWSLIRDMSVYGGVEAGMKCVMKKLRGKDDVQVRMVAGFGAGVVMFSMAWRESPEMAILGGVLFALAEGGLFKVREESSK